MTVTELIELLEDCDPDAEMGILSQENWPFENAISGLTVREEFEREDCVCDAHIDEEHDDGCPAGGELHREPGLTGNDVVVVMTLSGRPRRRVPGRRSVPRDSLTVMR